MVGSIRDVRCFLQGVIGDSGLQVHQVFEKFSAHDMVDDIDKRFEHFKSRIWPRLRDSGSAGNKQPL